MKRRVTARLGGGTKYRNFFSSTVHAVPCMLAVVPQNLAVPRLLECTTIHVYLLDMHTKFGP